MRGSFFVQVWRKKSVIDFEKEKLKNCNFKEEKNESADRTNFWNLFYTMSTNLQIARNHVLNILTEKIKIYITKETCSAHKI